MERGNQHGPRVDEELAEEVQGLLHPAHDEGRTEGRRQEDLAGGASVNEGSRRDDVGDPTDGLTEAELDLRSQIAAHLPPHIFPARAGDLAEAARDAGAPDEVLALLDGLPPEQEHQTVGEVWHSAGGGHEPGHS